MQSVWINGRFEPEGSAVVSVKDAGLLHAAGVFTTMRAYGGKVFRLAQHLHRLRDSCERFAIPLGYSNEQLEHAAVELLAKNSLAAARLRLTVTRGHLMGDHIEPTVFLTAAEFTPYPEEYYLKGLTAGVEDQFKLNPYDPQAGYKTLNYISRLAALRDANARGAGEALLFNVHNYLQSGAISNVFVVQGGTLLTPPAAGEMTSEHPYAKSAVLPGITRAAVLELAEKLEIPIHPAAIDIETLLAADEVFLTNSIMGVMPVCWVEKKGIGDERPGGVTLALMEAYEEMVDAASK